MPTTRKRRIVTWLVILIVGLVILSQVPAWLSRRDVDQRFVGRWMVQIVAADPPPLTGGMGRAGQSKIEPFELVLEDDGGGKAVPASRSTMGPSPFVWRVKADKLLIEREPSLFERIDRAFYRYSSGPGRPDEAPNLYRIDEVSTDEIVLYAGKMNGAPLEYHLRKSE